MEYYGLFLMSVVLTCAPTANGQDCQILQISDLGDTTTPSSTGLLPASILRNGSPPLLQIHQLNIVCLSQGSVRDTYGSTSVVVHFFDEQRDSNSTYQVEYRCENGTWRFETLILFPTATLATQLRVDCAICINPMATQTFDVTEDEHCAGE